MYIFVYYSPTLHETVMEVLTSKALWYRNNSLLLVLLQNLIQVNSIDVGFVISTDVITDSTIKFSSNIFNS